MNRRVRLVFPHQLFESLLEEPAGTRFLLVEDDLLFRHQPFHTQKLVLHRASMRLFAGRLRAAGFDVDVLETDPRRPSGARLADRLADLRPDELRVHDVVDDWLLRDLRAALTDAGLTLRPEDVEDTPNFLTSRAQLSDWFSNHQARMQPSTSGSGYASASLSRGRTGPVR